MHRSQLFGVNAWKSSTNPWRLKAGVRRMLGSLTFPHSCHLASWRSTDRTWKHTTESSWASQPSEKLLEQPEGHGKVSACQLNLWCSAWKVLLHKKTWKKSETMKTQRIFVFCFSRNFPLKLWRFGFKIDARPVRTLFEHLAMGLATLGAREPPVRCKPVRQQENCVLNFSDKNIKVRFYEYRLRIKKNPSRALWNIWIYISNRLK